MNVFSNALESRLSFFFDEMVELAIGACIVAALVWVVTWLGRHRLSSHATSWLWLLPLIALVLPIHRLGEDLPGPRRPRLLANQHEALPTRPDPRGEERPAAPVPETTHDEVVAAEATGTRDPHPRGAAIAAPNPARSTPPLPHSERPSLGAILFGVWSLVTLVLLGRLVRDLLRSRRLVLRCTRLEDHPAERMFPHLLDAAGVDPRCRLLVSETVDSPASWGLFRPVVVLPSGLLGRLSPAQCRWVILHELAHLRRRDPLFTIFERIVVALWWFHPAAWFARHQLDRNRELACDDAALARSPRARRNSTARAFYEVVAAVSEIRTPHPALVTLIDDRSFIRTRLMRMLDRDRPLTRGSSPRSFALVGVVACLSLGLARAQEAPFAEARVPTTTARVGAEDYDVHEVLQRGAAWLLEHQEKDGSFRVRELRKPRRHAGMESPQSLTARSLLAFIAMEPKLRKAKLATAIDRATRWLASQQAKDGSLAPENLQTRNFAHALALEALCAAQRREADAARMSAIQKAADWAAKARNPYLGWRYGFRDGDNDTRITSMMLLALLQARALGAEVSDQVIRDPLNYLRHCRDAEGRTGYNAKGKLIARIVETHKSHPAKHSEELSALASLVGLAAGDQPGSDELPAAGINLVASRPPQWRYSAEVDYSYWNYGTRLLVKLGGWQEKAWTQRLVATLVPRVTTGRYGMGLWPLDDAWSVPGLSVYATAVNLHSLALVAE